MKGLVIKNTGSWYQVKTDDGQSIECKIKGNFRLKGIRSTNLLQWVIVSELYLIRKALLLSVK